MLMRIRHRLRRLVEYVRYAPLYWYHHRIKFGITNTKFDISFRVFVESFIEDQYRIREFLDNNPSIGSLLFVDLGRNHGFVFYYALWDIIRRGLPLRRIVYVGVDPSPLKFVYWPSRRLPPGLEVDYRLIDRAVVFDDQETIRFKYGEGNFGNFNVAGSNYERKMKHGDFEYIEITVDTIRVERLLEMARETADVDAAIVKIDCKHKTEQILLAFHEALRGRAAPFLIACEADGSGGAAAAPFRARRGAPTLVASNALSPASA